MVKWITVLLLILSTLVVGMTQAPLNDACKDAIQLCPNVTLDASNVNATSTVCPDCEDDFNICFQPAKSVWFTFETNNSGGDVTFTLSNLLFNLDPNYAQFLQACVISTSVPCNSSGFKSGGYCDDTIRVSETFTAPGLLPNQIYYLVIGGGRTLSQQEAAEALFKLTISGPGIVRTPPVASISAQDTILCPFQPAVFSVNLANCKDTSSFQWSVNNTFLATTTQPFFNYGSIKNKDTVSVSCTCFSFCKVDVKAKYGPIEVDPIEVNAGDNRFVASGDKVILKGTVYNVTKSSWFPSNEVTLPNSLITTTYPTKTTVYSLTGTNGRCTLTDYVTIFVNDELVIPKSFSPNGDGTNDTWEIQGISIYPDTRVIVFDRWGQEVADIISYNKEKAWDGTFNGKPVPVGSYFYTIDFNDDDLDTMKGVVTVIR